MLCAGQGDLRRGDEGRGAERVGLQTADGCAMAMIQRKGFGWR